MKYKKLIPNRDSWKIGDQYRFGSKGNWLVVKNKEVLRGMPVGKIDPIWRGDARRPSKAKVVSKTVRAKRPKQQAKVLICPECKKCGVTRKCPKVDKQ